MDRRAAHIDFGRRHWLATAALASTSLVLPRWPRAETSARSDPFLMGVASGSPRADGCVLWTRLLPDGLFAPSGLRPSALVRWEVAADPQFLHIVRTGEVLAEAALGHSVHVELTGLAPDRWYHYRFMHGGAISPVGHTRTTPADSVLATRLRLAFASCQRWEHGHYAAWRHLVAEQPDLVVFLGDYIYEYASPKPAVGAGGNRRARPAPMRLHDLRTAHTLADYRDRYALHRSDTDLQAAHSACPWLVTWDDHEVRNDYAGTFGGDDAAGADIAFALQRGAAYQAFYENMPLRASVLPAHAAGLASTDSLALYGAHAWGALARLHLLDARQFRSRQACRSDSGSAGAAAVRPADCAELTDSTRSLLGRAQERWLYAGLAGDAAGRRTRSHTRFSPGEGGGGAGAAAGARWSVIAQQTLFSPRHYPSGVVSADSWDGYPAARARLLDAIVDHAPRNTVLLGGDIHQNYVCTVHADAANDQSPVVASEFCGTSISSLAGTTQAQVDAIARHNPQVLLAHCEQRGYGLADITPTRWTTRLRVLDDARRPDAAVATLAEFVVEDGRPGPVRSA